MRRILILAALCVLMGAGIVLAEMNSQCLTSFFTKSLHFTGQGMHYWYEKEGGFKALTGISYRELDCNRCHVKSCDTCHSKSQNGKAVFSKSKALGMNTCMPCHGGQGLTFRFDGERKRLDVHVAAGMVCADCHGGSDVHGDGQSRNSMRETGAVEAHCTNCHVDQESKSSAYDPESISHSLHRESLDCAACHVQNSMACYNCHFDRYLETQKREGNFVPMNSWMLLVNYEGKVTSGSVMTLTYKDRNFIAYFPYFTHSVTARGRDCNACHRNRAVLQMEKDQSVTVVDFRDGKLVPWRGVVPWIEGGLEWTFLDRTEDGWQPVSEKAPPHVQRAGYADPLTEEQYEILKQEVRVESSGG